MYQYVLYETASFVSNLHSLKIYGKQNKNFESNFYKTNF